ncbi:MAG: 2-phospho-L-lactate guanylyltransferase [Nitrosopumilus sp.]|nr:2-phospho-L-lactate guanylyltransferase [Nitrosopumilus sp.]MDH3737537.1 2-phospho-L-lactate guanylyltransferase [Nitrosopumilus sp.]MDH3822709.1 2-phospho-L-lactate guanylyltransferase [Nitrosopumilus sp.]MDH3832987.1 2-phospho-L-lactate guanylyltransferase [Nitrosopumilus sp.]
MKIAAIIPVKTFSKAKTRLDLSPHQKENLCKIMLEEILHTVSISPQIEKIIIVTKEEKAIEIGKKFNAITIIDEKEESVNSAVALADKYLLENGLDVSIVFPQDIPYIKTQDIDFMLNYKAPPNFVIVVPSRRFDGTNALVRMPVDLMETHYDEDSYKIHMNTAKEHTLNVALIFVKRIMWDVDNDEDLKFLLEQNEKPQIAEKIRKIIETN